MQVAGRTFAETTNIVETTHLTSMAVFIDVFSGSDYHMGSNQAYMENVRSLAFAACIASAGRTCSVLCLPLRPRL